METVPKPSLDTERQPPTNGLETGKDALYISLGEVSRVWHKGKATVSKDISRGKLQWHEHEGSRKLFAPEVSNLYGPPPPEQANGSETVPEQVQKSERQPPANGLEPHDFRALEAVVAAQRELIERLKDEVSNERQNTARERENTARERQNADHWRAELQSVKALPAPNTTAANQPEKRSWWPFRRSA